MGRAPCCDKANVKKGPWSPEEDAKLKEYIEKHGTGGNWIALPQKAGLKRCGKSCRLRWLNYLRPNIKHGEFSRDEDRVICTLFAAIGSRWSIIAAQLPGRTDNDIKNYWNTKLKKKLLGSIPPYQRKPLQFSYTNFSSFVQSCSSAPFSHSPTPSPILSYNPSSLTTITATTATSYPTTACNNNAFQPQDSLMGPVVYENQAYGGSSIVASPSSNIIEQMGLSDGYCSFNVEDSHQTMYGNVGSGSDFFSENPSDYGLEEIKQLLSSGSSNSSSSSSSSNYYDNGCNFILFDENKTSTDTQERIMLYY